MLRVYEYFKKTYSLTGDKSNNRVSLEGAGYSFAEEIDSRILRGIFRTTEELVKQDTHKQIVMKTQVNTHDIYLLHAVDEIKKVTVMQSQKVKTILERLFRKGKNTKYKFLGLDTNAFYAFIINNTPKLKIDFKQVTSQMYIQQSMVLEPKTASFVIPEQEIYKYSEVKKNKSFVCMLIGNILLRFVRIELVLCRNDYLNDIVKIIKVSNGFIRMVMPGNSIYLSFIQMDCKNNGFFIRIILYRNKMEKRG